MAKHEVVIIADYSQTTALTLQELCELCQISPDFIEALLEHGIIQPQGEMYSLQELQRIKQALRLQNDLEVNMAGVAVVLQLLEELEELRAQMNIMEKHYQR